MILLIGLVIAIIGTLGFALSPVPDFLLKRLAVPYSQIQLHNVLYLAIVFLALLFLAMGLATWIGGFFGSIDHADSEQVVNKGCESATGTTEACNQPKKKKTLRSASHNRPKHNVQTDVPKRSLRVGQLC